MSTAYAPKYRMSIEENIFVAKRNIVDYIWKSARLEGVNVTFPDTYAICERAHVKDIDVDAVLVVNNLKHAWQYILNHLDCPLTLDYICRVHAEVARGEALTWGELRTGTVRIGGTDYIPPVPQSDHIESELTALLNIAEPTERAIRTMLWGMKSQLFWDGNKRNSMLVANKIMIENGCGIISVPNELIADFNAILCDFYSNDTLSKAMSFVYDNCIDGMDFELQRKLSQVCVDAKAKAAEINSGKAPAAPAPELEQN